MISAIRRIVIDVDPSRVFKLYNFQGEFKAIMATVKSDPSEDHKQDLSTLLSTEECIELTLLIAHILEVMRKQQLQIFQVGSNPNVNHTKPLADTKEDDASRTLREKHEKELSAPKMIDLKKDCLTYFDEWRESVDSRVGAVVNNPTVVSDEQKKKASATASPHAVPTEPKVIRETYLHIFTWYILIFPRVKHKHRRS